MLFKLSKPYQINIKKITEYFQPKVNQIESKKLRNCIKETKYPLKEYKFHHRRYKTTSLTKLIEGTETNTDQELITTQIKEILSPISTTSRNTNEKNDSQCGTKPYNNPTIGTSESIIIIKLTDRKCNPNSNVDHNTVPNEALGDVNRIHLPTKINNMKSKADKVSSVNPNVSNIKSKKRLTKIRITKTKVINNSNSI